MPFEGDGDEEGEDGDIEDDLDALPMAFGDAPRLAPGASRSFHPRADAPAPDDLANGPDTPPPRI